MIDNAQMRNKLLSTALSLFLGVVSCLAQNTLNVHQTDGSIVRYAFSDKPIVSYTDTGIHLVTTQVEVDFPFTDLKMFTFEDETTLVGIETFTTVGSTDNIRIYTTAGVLVRIIYQNEGTAILFPGDLPAGIYIIKNGKNTYKIMKR